ncbi:MAG: high-potential iron-sulfur protein [Rhodoferax sp.]|nr:high-potential iron-sulfur protein [Rhodoferax sp.]
MTQRREFIAQFTVASTALWACGVQAAAPLVADSDPQAVQLGYKSDASKVDKAKFPKFAAGQACANCALYQGKPSDAAAACALFAGKQVAGKAWCNAYAKKA